MSIKKNFSVHVIIFLLTLFFANAIFGEVVVTAPDATTMKGPYAVQTGEYKFPAVTDNEVLKNVKTEVWGKIFYPQDLSKIQKNPLIVMLHGNHGTCGRGSHPRIDDSIQYTINGTCPKGYIPTPNHEGYDYLAKSLASWGFWVVSINANRGITAGGGTEDDAGLNLARGKLILKHLSLLYRWSTQGGAPASLGLPPNAMLGKIDFMRVGLFGHSRGGEGARAAYNLYRDSNSIWPAKIPDLSIKAIYEIGAVDGQTHRVLDAEGAVWNQLLPLCDGDVMDLEGRRPFERMMAKNAPINAQKSLFEVWGANHNFFNTEWQESDNEKEFCPTDAIIFNERDIGSEKQQKIAIASMVAFFVSNLGEKKDIYFNQNFNPLMNLPSTVTSLTQVDRDFTPMYNANEMAIIEDFDKNTGINTSGEKNNANNIKINHVYAPEFDDLLLQRIGDISWKSASTDTFFSTYWTPRSQGKNIKSFATLDFRIGIPNARFGAKIKTKVIDFGIRLEDAEGRLSNEIYVSQFSIINGPSSFNPILKTVRIPLAQFTNVDLQKVRGVRFVFDQTPVGHIYLANIRLHKNLGLGMLEKMTFARSHLTINHPKVTMRKLITIPKQFNSISINKIANQKRGFSEQPTIIFKLKSKIAFPVRDSLPLLKIGNQIFKVSQYADPIHLQALTFKISRDQYKTISSDEKIELINGKIWEFGKVGENFRD